MQNSSTFEERKRNANPRQNANILSKIFFWWTIPTFLKGFKKELDEEDLFKPLQGHESERLGDQLEIAWLREEQTHQTPTLLRPLIRVFGLEMLCTGIVILFIELVLRMSIPLLIGKLMQYYSKETSMSKTEAYYYSGGLVLLILLNVLIIHSYMLKMQTLGMKMRVACCSVVYRKSLRLSKSALAETTVGKMVNLLSNDVNRLDVSVLHVHSIWLAPIQTCIVLYLLYSQLGITAITGIALLIAFVPVQMYMGKKSSTFRLRTALRTDERVRLMNEIISGMQVIKMYTWENSFAKLVEMARKTEMHQIKATSYLRGITISLKMFVNRTAIYMCVLAYVLTNNELKASYVFVAIAFYNILRQSMTMSFPQGIASVAETQVSMQRITKFLLYEEVNSAAHNKKSKGYKKSSSSMKSMILRTNGSSNHKVGITIQNASAKWLHSSLDNTLNNIDMVLSSSELVAIVGPVGAGKSSVLNLLLGELNTLTGKVEVSGLISYASQEPWLFAGTVMQNILFGEPMVRHRYEEVIKVCALERDLSLFPYGDKTIVGERGVTMSGGQKARINLARAIYREADIYILDDPLSAVDTHVGKQLFDDCISQYLKDKCTILVTHQLQYLRNVDRIYVLENGEIVASGTYEDLQASGKSYAKLFQDKSLGEEEGDNLNPAEKNAKYNELESGSPVESKEIRSIGTVTYEVYGRYFQAGGTVCSFILVMMLFVSAQSVASLCDYFITFWVNMAQDRKEGRSYANDVKDNATGFSNSTAFKQFVLLNNTENGTNFDNNPTETPDNLPYSNTSIEFAAVSDPTFFTDEMCIYAYSMIIGAVIIITLSRSLYAYLFCMRASTNLHNNMFYKIVYAPMRFFNTNSSGRILNRFSKDMGSIDESLPTVIIDTFQIGLNVLAITILNAIINPWILIPSIIILVIFYAFRIFYLKTSRSIKRMEGTTKSPVFSHITASLQGLTTIRAFGAQDKLRSEFDSHQDLHSSAFYMFLGCTRLFGMGLDLVCVCYIASVTLGFLVLGKETYGGDVGLSITQSISLTGMFQWGMRQWSELENQMTSVERVIEYVDIAPEKDRPTREAPVGWPEYGELTFKSVSMNYAEDEDYVLKNLNFTVRPMEKVGIVGRTGAGKSSLITALFRLTEIEGDIFIDNINTQDITLHELRSKISIIPQEPVLFSGTLRKNLDPFEEYSDASLWNALEKVELKTVIYDLPAGLETTISEGGSNFSVGQRQLICLARAIIRNNRILILDEATANVDPRTDSLIQAAIRNEFAECTVLTIAHRLYTVMDSDKVLVMDNGSAIEFDHPYVLLQNINGIFHDLVKQTGKSMAENLTDVARKSYEQ